MKRRYIFEEECGYARARRRSCRSASRWCGPGDRHVRHAGAEAARTAADPPRRGVLVQGFRSRARARTSRRCGPERCATAITTSSTGRRRGPRWPTRRLDVQPGPNRRGGAKQQEGISFLLIDMKSPGVTVRPIITIDGGHEVNEVFFEMSRVPARTVSAKRIGMDGRQNPAGPRADEYRAASGASRRELESLKT